MNQPDAMAMEPDTAVLTCMDQRLDPVVILGISRHEAQVIRNAGGHATDDAIRSLCLSQQLAGTRRIVVLHHSDCRASEFADQELRAKVEAGTGVRPTWSTRPVLDPHQRLREAMESLDASPLLSTSDMAGYVYDHATGELATAGERP